MEAREVILAASGHRHAHSADRHLWFLSRLRKTIRIQRRDTPSSADKYHSNQPNSAFECVRIVEMHGRDVEYAQLTHNSTVEIHYPCVHVMIAVDVSTSLLTPHRATGLLYFDHLLPNVLLCLEKLLTLAVDFSEVRVSIVAQGAHVRLFKSLVDDFLLQRETLWELEERLDFEFAELRLACARGQWQPCSERSSSPLVSSEPNIGAVLENALFFFDVSRGDSLPAVIFITDGVLGLPERTLLHKISSRVALSDLSVSLVRIPTGSAETMLGSIFGDSSLQFAVETVLSGNVVEGIAPMRDCFAKSPLRVDFVKTHSPSNPSEFDKALLSIVTRRVELPAVPSPRLTGGAKCLMKRSADSHLNIEIQDLIRIRVGQGFRIATAEFVVSENSRGLSPAAGLISPSSASSSGKDTVQTIAAAHISSSSSNNSSTASSSIRINNTLTNNNNNSLVNNNNNNNNPNNNNNNSNNNNNNNIDSGLGDVRVTAVDLVLEWHPCIAIVIRASSDLSTTPSTSVKIYKRFNAEIRAQLQLDSKKSQSKDKAGSGGGSSSRPPSKLLDELSLSVSSVKKTDSQLVQMSLFNSPEIRLSHHAGSAVWDDFAQSNFEEWKVFAQTHEIEMILSEPSAAPEDEENENLSPFSNSSIPNTNQFPSAILQACETWSGHSSLSASSPIFVLFSIPKASSAMNSSNNSNQTAAQTTSATTSSSASASSNSSSTTTPSNNATNAPSSSSSSSNPPSSSTSSTANQSFPAPTGSEQTRNSFVVCRPVWVSSPFLLSLQVGVFGLSEELERQAVNSLMEELKKVVENGSKEEETEDKNVYRERWRCTSPPLLDRRMSKLLITPTVMKQFSGEENAAPLSGRALISYLKKREWVWKLPQVQSMTAVCKMLVHARKQQGFFIVSGSLAALNSDQFLVMLLPPRENNPRSIMLQFIIQRQSPTCVVTQLWVHPAFVGGISSSTPFSTSFAPGGGGVGVGGGGGGGGGGTGRGGGGSTGRSTNSSGRGNNSGSKVSEDDFVVEKGGATSLEQIAWLMEQQDSFLISQLVSFDAIQAHIRKQKVRLRAPHAPSNVIPDVDLDNPLINVKSLFEASEPITRRYEAFSSDENSMNSDINNRALLECLARNCQAQSTFEWFAPPHMSTDGRRYFIQTLGMSVIVVIVLPPPVQRLETPKSASDDDSSALIDDGKGTFWFEVEYYPVVRLVVRTSSNEGDVLATLLHPNGLPPPEPPIISMAYMENQQASACDAIDALHDAVDQLHHDFFIQQVYAALISNLPVSVRDVQRALDWCHKTSADVELTPLANTLPLAGELEETAASMLGDARSALEVEMEKICKSLLAEATTLLQPLFAPIKGTEDIYFLNASVGSDPDYPTDDAATIQNGTTNANNNTNNNNNNNAVVVSGNNNNNNNNNNGGNPSGGGGGGGDHIPLFLSLSRSDDPPRVCISCMTTTFAISMGPMSTWPGEEEEEIELNEFKILPNSIKDVMIGVYRQVRATVALEALRRLLPKNKPQNLNKRFVSLVRSLSADAKFGASLNGALSTMPIGFVARDGLQELAKDLVQQKRKICFVAVGDTFVAVTSTNQTLALGMAARDQHPPSRSGSAPLPERNFSTGSGTVLVHHGSSFHPATRANSDMFAQVDVPYWLLLRFSATEAEILLQPVSDLAPSLDWVKEHIAKSIATVNQKTLLRELNETRMPPPLLFAPRSPDTFFQPSEDADNYPIGAIWRLKSLSQFLMLPSEAPPGHLACPCVHQIFLPCHPRIEPMELVRSLAVETLAHFSVVDRSDTFVYQQGPGEVFYMRLIVYGSQPDGSGMIRLRIHGTGIPTPEVIMRLQEMMSSRSDYLTLQAISAALFRNPLYKLSTPDLNFLQPPDSPPTSSKTLILSGVLAQHRPALTRIVINLSRIFSPLRLQLQEMERGSSSSVMGGGGGMDRSRFLDDDSESICSMATNATRFENQSEFNIFSLADDGEVNFVFNYVQEAAKQTPAQPHLPTPSSRGMMNRRILPGGGLTHPHRIPERSCGVALIRIKLGARQHCASTVPTTSSSNGLSKAGDFPIDEDADFPDSAAAAARAAVDSSSMDLDAMRASLTPWPLVVEGEKEEEGNPNSIIVEVWHRGKIKPENVVARAATAITHAVTEVLLEAVAFQPPLQHHMLISELGDPLLRMAHSATSTISPPPQSLFRVFLPLVPPATRWLLRSLISELHTFSLNVLKPNCDGQLVAAKGNFQDGMEELTINLESTSDSVVGIAMRPDMLDPLAFNPNCPSRFFSICRSVAYSKNPVSASRLALSDDGNRRGGESAKDERKSFIVADLDANGMSVYAYNIAPKFMKKLEEQVFLLSTWCSSRSYILDQILFQKMGRFNFDAFRGFKVQVPQSITNENAAGGNSRHELSANLVLSCENISKWTASHPPPAPRILAKNLEGTGEEENLSILAAAGNMDENMLSVLLNFQSNGHVATQASPSVASFLRVNALVDNLQETHWASIGDPIRRHALHVSNAASDHFLRLQGAKTRGAVSAAALSLSTPLPSLPSLTPSAASTPSGLSLTHATTSAFDHVDRHQVVDHFRSKSMVIYSRIEKMPLSDCVQGSSIATKGVKEPLTQILLREISKRMESMGCILFYVDQSLDRKRRRMRHEGLESGTTSAGTTSRGDLESVGSTSMGTSPSIHTALTLLGAVEKVSFAKETKFFLFKLIENEKQALLVEISVKTELIHARVFCGPPPADVLLPVTSPQPPKGKAREWIVKELRLDAFGYDSALICLDEIISHDLSLDSLAASIPLPLIFSRMCDSYSTPPTGAKHWLQKAQVYLRLPREVSINVFFSRLRSEADKYELRSAVALDRFSAPDGTETVVEKSNSSSTNVATPASASSSSHQPNFSHYHPEQFSLVTPQISGTIGNIVEKEHEDEKSRDHLWLVHTGVGAHLVLCLSGSTAKYTPSTPVEGGGGGGGGGGNGEVFSAPTTANTTPVAITPGSNQNSGFGGGGGGGGGGIPALGNTTSRSVSGGSVVETAMSRDGFTEIMVSCFVFFIQHGNQDARETQKFVYDRAMRTCSTILNRAVDDIKREVLWEAILDVDSTRSACAARDLTEEDIAAVAALSKVALVDIDPRLSSMFQLDVDWSQLLTHLAAACGHSNWRLSPDKQWLLMPCKEEGLISIWRAHGRLEAWLVWRKEEKQSEERSSIQRNECASLILRISHWLWVQMLP